MLGMRGRGRRRWMACCAAVLALPLSLAGAHAQERWVVGAQGAPMSLDEAVARAADGDTIELLAGDFAGGLVLEQRRLDLVGMGKVRVLGRRASSAATVPCGRFAAATC